MLRLSARISDSFQLDAKEDELLCSWRVEKQDVGTTWPVRVFDLPPPSLMYLPRLSPTYPPRLIWMTLELTAENKVEVQSPVNDKIRFTRALDRG